MPRRLLALIPFTGSAAARVVRFHLLVFAGLTAAVGAGAVLTWDGSYYLFKLLNAQTPFIPHEGYGFAVPQWIVLAASHVTSNVHILWLVFGAACAAVPLGSLLLCWWVVRRDVPSLMVWPALGIAITMLPGLIFLVAEPMLTMELAWPLLLITMVGFTRRTIIVGALLGVAMFALHPVAAPLLGGIGIASILRGWSQPGARTAHWLWAGGLLAAAAVRPFVLIDEYDRSNVGVRHLMAQFSAGVAGAPLLATLLALAAGAIALGARSARAQSLPRAVLTGAQVGPLVLVLPLLVRWASRGPRWAGELDFRDPVFFLLLPLATLAVVDALLNVRRTTPSEAADRFTGVRMVSVELAGLIPFAVLSVQGFVLHSELNNVSHQVASATGPCLAPTATGVAGTPLDSWAVGSLVIDLQGREPHTLVLDDAGCAQLKQADTLVVTSFDTLPDTGGWFDLRPHRR